MADSLSMGLAGDKADTDNDAIAVKTLLLS